MSKPNRKPKQDFNEIDDDMLSFYKYMEFERMRKQHETNNQPTSKKQTEYDDDKERKVIGYLIVILTIVFVVLGYINKFTSDDKPNSHKAISSLHYPTEKETHDYMEFLDKQSGKSKPPKKFYDDLQFEGK